ncbi:MAG: carotenoid oxygenase family protein [Acidimicrobiales bacterium]
MPCSSTLSTCPPTPALSRPERPTLRDCSESHVFDATDITAGPIARVRLPERISSGTHSCWTPASALAPS